MFVYTGRVHGRVHGPSCTWQVGLPRHVYVPRRHTTALCGPHRAVHVLVHSPFTAVYTAVYDGRYTAVRHLHTSTQCTRHVHVRVHGQYTVVFMAGRPTRPCTWAVCRNGPHTAVACHLGMCTRPGRPTCSIHGPDGPRTRPCNAEYTGHYTVVYALCRRPKTAVYTASVHSRKRPCTRPVHYRVHQPIRLYTAVYTTNTRRYTAVYGRVDGRFRLCRWPVHGRVHVPCTGPCTRHVHGRRRPYSPCTQSCTRVV